MNKLITNGLMALMMSLLFIGCKDDAVIDVTSGGKLSGKISNYKSGTYNMIVSYDMHKSMVGTCMLDDKGNFSQSLQTPDSLESLGSATGNYTVSDENVKGASVGTFITFLDGNSTGQIFKCNSLFDPTNMKDGFEIVTLIYVDGNATIKGSETESGQTYTYSLNLKKGWNEVMMKYSGTSVALTSKLASDLKWTYFPETAYYTKQLKIKLFR